MSKTLTHFNEAGEAHMVDISAKSNSQRIAIAEGFIEMAPETLSKIVQGNHKKGDVLGIARIAGIMASKRTAELIPLCHPLMLNRVQLDLESDPIQNGVHCRAEVAVNGKTGVEIEALCAVQIALLTIYDMCKAIDRSMTIQQVQLRHKSGGQSGTYHREDPTT